MNLIECFKLLESPDPEIAMLGYSMLKSSDFYKANKNVYVESFFSKDDITTYAFLLAHLKRYIGCQDNLDFLYRYLLSIFKDRTIKLYESYEHTS